MIHTETTVRTLQAVAIIVGIAVFLWGTGLPTLFHTVEAASITDASDVLSNSAPGQSSDHTISFTTENGLSIGQTIAITFPVGFSLAANFGAEDLVLTVDGTATTVDNGASGADQWGLATTSTSVTLTTPTNSGVASTSAIIVYLGQVGPGSSGTEDQITNPTATTSTYQIDIGGTMADSGSVRVAIIDQVTVSASVNTSLTFTVAGVGSGGVVNGTTTTGAATHVALPFGTLDINEPKVLAQRLNVSTNATNGYTVTVEQTGELQSTTGAVIDGFVDGSWTQTPTAWQAPGANILNTASYGHWGLTSTDGTTTRLSEFSSDTWVSGSTTPIVIMGHDGPADGTTNGFGSTTVGYQIEISALQEAGDDYTTTLRYVATPTF